jgi:3-methyl-2-oxobutanoate hydroxymethyltransferase
LVWTDFAGLHAGNPRRFVKQYLELRKLLVSAAKDYRQEVSTGRFPSKDNEF